VATETQGRRVDTVKLKGGVEYAKVASRLLAFHEDHEACSIETDFHFKDGWAIVKAKVSNSRGTFSGHSMGKVAAEKAFEKLESIAVGRALAFAGYLANGEIATVEEMDRFSGFGIESKAGNVVVDSILAKVQADMRTPEQAKKYLGRLDDMTANGDLSGEDRDRIIDRMNVIAVERGFEF
jgi:hypothetical protein